MELPPPALEFTVFGVPATAGNKTAFPVRTKDGRLRVAVREGKKAGPSQVWRGRVETVVQRLAEQGVEILEGPLWMDVTFYLPKPKSAPKRRRIWPDKKPDRSKLLRAIEDPMKGVLIRDDSQFVDGRIRKVYADDDFDQRPRAKVTIWRVEDQEGEPQLTGVGEGTA